MSKFCEFCGAQMEDNASVCPGCNATPSGANATVNTTGVNNASVTGNVENNNANIGTVDSAVSSTATASAPNKNKIVPMIIAGFAALVFLSIVVSVLGGGFKKPLDNFAKGFNKEDAKYLMKAYPELYSEEFEDYLGNDFEDFLEDSLESSIDRLEDKYGKNIKVKYKVLDKEKMDKDDLEDLEDEIEDDLDESVKISKGYELEVEFTVKGKKKARTKEIDVNVIKMDGKWVIVDLLPDTISGQF